VEELESKCSTHGGDEFHAEFLSGSLNGKDNLEELEVDASIILEWFLKRR
jgi:hypothetical protein